MELHQKQMQAEDYSYYLGYALSHFQPELILEVTEFQHANLHLPKNESEIHSAYTGSLNQEPLKSALLFENS